MARGVHDYGGLPAGPIDRTDHPPTPYEKRVDAVRNLVSRLPERPLGTDMHRRAIEQLSQEAYDSLGYYDKWVLALRRNLVELGHLDEAEIARKITEIKAR
jgi:hypothetical protein